MTGQLTRAGAVICDVADVTWLRDELATVRTPAAAAAPAARGVTFTIDRNLGHGRRADLDLVIGGWSIPIRITEIRFRRAIAQVRCRA
ncbi:MAG TPA: hypothetical protein VGQ83_16920 [Polyangia bacterium]|jgi:hypothetical protein